MPRKRIHTRTVTIEVYDEGDGTISLEGRLEDVQPTDSGYFNNWPRANDPRPPGVMHGLSARFRVDTRTSEIIRSDGEFPSPPNEGCEAVVGWLGRLDGVKIERGSYSAQSKELLGGTKGCVHMNALHQMMANTKMVATAYFMKSPDDRKASMEQVQKAFGKNGRLPNTDSCHMWRKGGPLEQKILDRVQSMEADGKL